jgi:cytoskeletal protein RodZ
MSRVGELLQEERTRQGASLVDISRETRIRTLFLQALEEGEHSRFPSVCHAKGFAISYAQALGLDGNAIARQLQNEMTNNQDKGRGAFDKASETDKKSTDTHEIPWKVVGVLVVGILLVGAIVWGLTTFVLGESSNTPSAPLQTISSSEATATQEGEE